MRVHFVGAGGVSMSALAKLCIMRGNKVSGSDMSFGRYMEELVGMGAEVWLGSDTSKITDADLVVHSSAVPVSNPEVELAKKMGIPTLERMGYLSEVARDFKSTIAVAGTHGKTTVTAMLAEIFLQSGRYFTAHIGGTPVGRSNLIYRGDEVFITEACEYKKSFLSLSPDVSLITNVELDHPDTYQSLGKLYSAFDEFVSKSKGVVINADSLYYRSLFKGKSKAVTYGISPRADYMAQAITDRGNGSFGFTLCEYGIPKCEIALSVLGKHNVGNAVGAIAAARKYGLVFDVISKSLSGFRGVERRLEVKGKLNGAWVILDYAHHPSELFVAIETARNLRQYGKVIIAFQPHTYSRTSAYLKDFKEVLLKADECYIYKEYSARETPDMGVSAFGLYNELKGEKRELFYYDSMVELAGKLVKTVKADDVLLIAGAGNIELLSDLVLD